MTDGNRDVAVLLEEVHGDYRIKVEYRWYHRLRLAVFIYHPASGWNYRAAANDLRKITVILDQVIKEELK